MGMQNQLTLFEDPDIQLFRLVYEDAMKTVAERCELVKKEFSDAWIVGSHGLLQERHYDLVRHPDPLLRLGYKYGCEDNDKFSFTELDHEEYAEIEQRVTKRLDFRKRPARIYTRIFKNDLLSSSGKPYETRAGIERHIEKYGCTYYCVIQVNDYEKGSGWIGRLKKDMEY